MSFIKNLQRKLLHRPQPGLNLPTEPEIDPEGSNDGQTAVTHFLGKTREQITKELATRQHWYFYEDFYYLGGKAFCFYFPAVVDYVATPQAKLDSGVVTNFCDVIESRLKFDPVGIRGSFPAIAQFADYVSAHLGEFGYEPEDEGQELERLRVINQLCAEIAAQNDPALWQRRRVTQAHLEAACKLLPLPPEQASGTAQRLLNQYRECLEGAELERALDTLQELGELIPCRGGYWRNLERAAQSMDLVGRIPQLRRRFEQTAKRANSAEGG